MKQPCFITINEFYKWIASELIAKIPVSLTVRCTQLSRAGRNQHLAFNLSILISDRVSCVVIFFFYVIYMKILQGTAKFLYNVKGALFHFT